jgi:hypothetical protein
MVLQVTMGYFLHIREIIYLDLGRLAPSAVLNKYETGVRTKTSRVVASYGREANDPDYGQE